MGAAPVGAGGRDRVSRSCSRPASWSTSACWRCSMPSSASPGTSPAGLPGSSRSAMSRFSASAPTRRRSCRCVSASRPGSGLPVAALAGALVGGVIAVLSFRAGLKGSYFALITLAFAEVLRIVSNSVGITGGGLGMLIPMKVGRGQFPVRRTQRLLFPDPGAGGRLGRTGRVAAALAFRRATGGDPRERGRGHARWASTCLPRRSR